MGIWQHWNHRPLRSEVDFLMPEARSISELTKDFCPERRQRIEEHKEQLRQQLILAALHKAVPNCPD